jgi:hypothetical protein
VTNERAKEEIKQSMLSIIPLTKETLLIVITHLNLSALDRKREVTLGLTRRRQVPICSFSVWMKEENLKLIIAVGYITASVASINSFMIVEKS